MQPDERLGAGLIGNLEPGRETGRIKRDCRRARQQLVGAYQPVLVGPVGRLDRLQPRLLRQGALGCPVRSARAIDSKVRAGGAVLINLATPQAERKATTRSPTAETEMVARQDPVGKPYFGALPNDPGAFDVASDCSGGVPAAGIKRRIQIREGRIHLSFPEH